MALAIAIFFALLTLAGITFSLLALWGARDFVRFWRTAKRPEFAPGVTVMKPLKGVDPKLYAAFASHCTQQYEGPVQLLFGVSDMDDPAVAEVHRLQAEFPQMDIVLVHCPLRLGTSGKVSNLAQMLPHARHEYIVINDADIVVSPRYLARIMSPFDNARTGMVTCAYRVVTATRGATLWAKFEALGVSCDFIPGLLTARRMEKGIRFGLGATLATRKRIIEEIGGLESIVEYLADDYELGLRISQAGYEVVLSDEIVDTSAPQYDAAGYWTHQLRWYRTVRDARPGGYFGLPLAYCVPWAVATVIASGFDLWSFSLLSMALLARIAVCLAIGVGVLRDGQVLRDLWLVPFKDVACLLLWLYGLMDNTIEWRGETFRLDKGKLIRAN
ncbi:bacteriohopanetetrol glucosamine biosynthesis glycosyltransferase HpnI [Terriglobus albidus]|uniref:bacteriohopanetetrol glucosamine biosynthesis glycosyltransferase HpnI n=1 Tax=Terriglobus albidus TaxID=1592106 RepID=UPI0021E085E6|nr:bacteriohopanetetrol glucosamine biosynthesis glycosyltransferase HpnI [Terriglobus albidus]